MKWLAAELILICVLGSCQATEPTSGPAVVATKGEVWPRPLQTTKYDGVLVFSADNFVFQISDNSHDCPLLRKALARYHGILKTDQANRWGLKMTYQGNVPNMRITLQAPCTDNEYPHLDDNETYSLTVTSHKSELFADTIWGIMRGLETFSQLIFLQNENLHVQETFIFDRPRYRHRGLLLDTARHYVPLGKIYEILNGMAFNKLNVFHWHITDDQSFPYGSEKYPELSAKGAYNSRQVYKMSDIIEVIEYARERGIRVVPEFDTPGHTKSWGLSHPELLCQYQGRYGPLDPSKDSTYDFLKEIFSEARSIFKDNYIHLGGDEVDYTCWTSAGPIVEFMEQHNLTQRADYINYYGQKLINMVQGLDFSSIVWEEMFFDGVQLPNSTVVQIWRDWWGQRWTDNIRTVTKAGNKAILSACWYLDNAGKTWQNYYNCDPSNFQGTEAQAELIIGGEACLWGEMINQYNVVPGVFPKVCATAQKLWSERSSGGDLNLEAQRLEEHACRMNRRGVSAGPPNGPGYCD